MQQYKFTNSLLQATFDCSFFLFSFTRYAVINSHWRTRSALRGFHFKEDHNVRSPFTRKFQSELAIYGVVYGRTSRNSLSECTQIRSSPQRRVTARDLLFDLAPLPRFLYLFFFSPTGNDNPKRYFYGLQITFGINAIL